MDVSMIQESRVLNDIIHLSSELNTVQDLDILLDRILTEARRILNADAASIQIKEGDELIFSHVQTESLQKNYLPDRSSSTPPFGQRSAHHQYQATPP